MDSRCGQGPHQVFPRRVLLGSPSSWQGTQAASQPQVAEHRWTELHTLTPQPSVVLVPERWGRRMSDRGQVIVSRDVTVLG